MLDGSLHPEIAWPSLAIGALAAVGASAIPGPRRPQVWAGCAAVVAVVATTNPPSSTTVGLVLLAMLGFAPLEGGTPAVVATVLAATIGVALALISIGLPAEIATWDLTLWLVVVSVTYLAASVGQWFGPPTGLVLLGITAAGMWATLPDTEVPLAAGLSLLPLVAVALWSMLVGDRRWEPFDHPARWIGVVAATAWAALVGGRARPGSVAAAIACYGVVVTAGLVFGIVAVVVSARRRTGRASTVGGPPRVVRSQVILIAGQLLTDLMAARWRLPRLTLDDARLPVVVAAGMALVTALAALVSERRVGSHAIR